MLFLSGEDIHRAVTTKELLDEVEETMRFYEVGTFKMPLRTSLEYGPNTLLLMPCFTDTYFGTKLISLAPDNPAKGLPMINSLMVINHTETGEPLAVMNGSVLTSLRTGAVGGVAVRHLSPGEPHGLGIVGAGVQGFQQARFAAAEGKIDRITVFDVRQDSLSDFVQKLSTALPNLTVESTDRIEKLLEDSRTIITATTSNDPVFPDDASLLEGRHFVGIGSYKPTMREFPKALFRLLDRVFVDTEHALEESGDLLTPLQEGWIGKDQIQTFGSFLESGEIPDPLHRQTTLFKSVGMALFDVRAGALVVKRATEQGLGRHLEL